MCRCAALGGAAGLRVDGAVAVRSASDVTGLPVIGLEKVWRTSVALREGRPAITPTVTGAVLLAAAGAAIVAVEATKELHGAGASDHLKAVRGEMAALVMADVSTLAEGMAAYDAGADLVSTTLSGYTADSVLTEEPDLQLVAELAQRGVPTVAEGRICSPQLARLAGKGCGVRGSRQGDNRPSFSDGGLRRRNVGTVREVLAGRQGGRAAIGVDVGGTKIAAAIVGPNGSLNERTVVPTEVVRALRALWT